MVKTTNILYSPIKIENLRGILMFNLRDELNIKKVRNPISSLDALHTYPLISFHF